MPPFRIAFSAIHSFADGRPKYRVLYCEETYLDNLTCEKAIAHINFMNANCGFNEEGVAA